MVNFGLLAAETVSLVWGTPANFNGFRVLAALLHGTLVVGVSQTAAFNRGRHLYSAGRPSGWALAHISSNVFRVFWLKHAAFKWKDEISGFPVSPGSAEALVRRGGKIKYILIAYFLGNICAKNYRNRTTCVKIIASHRWDVFWDTVYSDLSLVCSVPGRCVFMQRP